MKTRTFLTSITLLALLSSLAQATPMGTAFTYQGKLSSGPGVVTGLYDFTFTLWDAYSGGTQLGVTNLNAFSALPVTNGLFTVTLDFGAGMFTGDARWLAIAVRTNGSVADPHALPRQRLLPAPQALWAQNAGTAAAGAVSASSLDTVGPPAAGQVLTYDGTQLTWTTPSSAGPAWSLTGNSGTTGANFLGTTDNQPLELKANGQRALRLVSTLDGAPDIVAGAPFNYVSGAQGATVGGGGTAGYLFGLHLTNGTAADFSTVSGGADNLIEAGAEGGVIGGGKYHRIRNGAYAGVISGGDQNSIGTNATYATIAGGSGNTIGTGADYAAILGGNNNQVQSTASQSVIAGGSQNRIEATSYNSSIGGGIINVIGANANNSVIGGGYNNMIAASANYGTIPGGQYNQVAGSFSFAAGLRAKALHNGTFVWADNQWADFASTGGGQFLIRAGGGVGIGTTSPQQLLHVGGSSCFDGNVGIGTTAPQQLLHVAGIGRFDVGVGSVSISSPGGNPGVIAYAGNGHRRDIVFQDDAMRLLVGSSSALPSVGIDIFENGTTQVKVLTITGGSDLAEPFAISDAEPVPKGSVMVIDEQNPGQLRVSTEPYDQRVAGVLSGAGGLNPGLTIAQQGVTDQGAPVALSGRVYTLVDTSNGPIQPGDLLTTSATPGHAMKATDHAKAQGAIIGKAMTSIKEGRGLVLVLVSLQ